MGRGWGPDQGDALGGESFVPEINGAVALEQIDSNQAGR